MKDEDERSTTSCAFKLQNHTMNKSQTCINVEITLGRRYDRRVIVYHARQCASHSPIRSMYSFAFHFNSTHQSYLHILPVASTQRQRQLLPHGSTGAVILQYNDEWRKGRGECANYVSAAMTNSRTHTHTLTTFKAFARCRCECVLSNAGLFFRSSICVHSFCLPVRKISINCHS